MRIFDAKALNETLFVQNYVKRELGGPRVGAKRVMRAPKGLPGGHPRAPKGAPKVHEGH